MRTKIEAKPDNPSVRVLSQELHYVYDSWSRCEVGVSMWGIEVSIDGAAGHSYGDWALYPANTTLVQLSDGAFLERLSLR